MNIIGYILSGLLAIVVTAFAVLLVIAVSIIDRHIMNDDDTQD